jgi:RNA polymerase sigma-70 factor, ECF subfamily
MSSTPRHLPEIYSEFHSKIVRYLTRLVGESEAEDLAQEVFMKAGLALPNFRGEASISTWLYRIATNTAYDRLRSPAFQRMEPLEQAEAMPTCESWSSIQPPLVEQQFVKQEMGECIQRFIADLPENYRAVLLLSDLEEFSNPEIAEILGVTVDTVKIRLHRARSQLREALESRCEHYWMSELGWNVG